MTNSKAARRRQQEAYGDDAVPVSKWSEPLKSKLEKADWWIIVVLCVIGGTLRIATLGHAPLWFDEMWTWRVSHLGYGGLFTALKEDIHLPNFFLIEATFINLFGDSEIVMRLPAAIFSTLSIGAIYVLGRRLFGRLVGIMAATYLAFAAFSFYYGQEARPYSMMMFLGIVTTYLWYQIYERIFVEQEPVGNLGIGLFLAVAVNCFTHYFCILLTLFQIAIFALIAIKRRRARKLLVYYCIGWLVLAALWMPTLLQQLKVLFTWTQVMPFGEALHNFLVFTFGGVAMGDKSDNLGVFFAGLLGCSMFLLFFRKGSTLLNLETDREYFICLTLALLWIGPFLITEGVSLAISPIFVDRYLLFAVPFGLLAVVFQVSRLNLSSMSRLLILFVIVGLQAAVAQRVAKWYTEPYRGGQGDWQEVVTQVKDSLPTSGKTVVLAVTERVGVAPYYFNRIIPGLQITGSADRRSVLPQAFQDTLNQHPDHIILFYGQIVQKEQTQTILDAEHAMERLYGHPEVISMKRGSGVGAFLFNTHH